MTVILTYKYRIKDKRAKKALAAHAVACNQVWNWCNGYQRHIERQYRAGAPKKQWPSNFTLHRLTAGCSVLLGIHSDTVQEVCRQFAKSRDANKGSLRFRKSFDTGRSLGWIPFKSRAIRVSGNTVTYLGKTLRLFGVKSRPLPANIKTGCFVEDARGRWYVCLTAEQEYRETGIGEVGIDLGLKNIATLSTGETIPALQHYRRYERMLATAQRARNTKRIKAIHARIANARKDQIHKATTKIARENKLIVIGNVSSPKLVKTRMAKSVLDAGWGMLRAQLAYKVSRHQATLVVVDEYMTSRSCSSFGAVSGPKGIAGVGIRRWSCSECGTSHDRDENAARNILIVGRSSLPHADGSRSAVS